MMHVYIMYHFYRIFTKIPTFKVILILIRLRYSVYVRKKEIGDGGRGLCVNIYIL